MEQKRPANDGSAQEEWRPNLMPQKAGGTHDNLLLDGKKEKLREKQFRYFALLLTEESITEKKCFV